MYDELLKMLRTCAERDSCIGWREACPYLGTGVCDNKAEKAADAIEALICEVATEHNARLDAEDRLHWIPVTERLPEEAGQYLVSVYQPDDENAEGYSLVVPAWYNPKAFPFTTIGWTLLNEWYDLTPRLRENITHWMPLPQPPEEE